MTHSNPLVLAVLAAAALALTAVQNPVPIVAAQAARTPRHMALTFDDLPYAYVAPGEVGALAKAQRVTSALLRVLASHHAPVVAFVNEAKLESGPELGARTALLQQWVGAGAILGNHTYSHADFNTLTIRQFEDEILKGEVVTRRLMRPRQPYQLYFRHPQTHTGDTQAKKEAIEAFLEARGYKVAPHTIDSSDYIFNRGYIQTLGRDEATATRLREAYLDFVVRATEFAEGVSRQIFGRDIPQTILLHANDINADSLDDLLKRLEARGYAFVSLDTAVADPAYRTKDTLVTKFGPTWLWRWVKSQGMSVSFREDPEPPQWVMELPKTAAR
jgi:peptidoglycan/xylan/chitin deacetylase (PgdA/CDA1 family)